MIDITAAAAPWTSKAVALVQDNYGIRERPVLDQRSESAAFRSSLSGGAPWSERPYAQTVSSTEVVDNSVDKPWLRRRNPDNSRIVRKFS